MVKKSRIGQLMMILGTLSIFGLPGVHAQEFPTKPIDLNIPFGAGGSSDLTARAMLGTAVEYLGQPIMLHLKPGGGGAIASEAVAQAKPDGYTLLFGHTNSNTVLPLMEGRSRGPADYAPVCHINTTYGFLIAQPNAPFKTFKEMIEWAKANPGQLTFGNLGTWSLVDFMWKQIEYHYGIKTRSVTYDGGGQAVIGILGGHVLVSHGAPTTLIPQIKAGKLRALAFSAPRRHPDLPDVPSAVEAGYGFASVGSWKGILAPKGTPRPIIDKLALGFKKMTENKQAIETLRKMGDEFEYMGPDEFEKFLRADYQKFQEVVKTFKK